MAASLTSLCSQITEQSVCLSKVKITSSYCSVASAKLPKKGPDLERERESDSGVRTSERQNHEGKREREMLDAKRISMV